MFLARHASDARTTGSATAMWPAGAEYPGPAHCPRL